MKNYAAYLIAGYVFFAIVVASLILDSASFMMELNLQKHVSLIERQVADTEKEIGQLPLVMPVEKPCPAQQPCQNISWQSLPNAFPASQPTITCPVPRKSQCQSKHGSLNSAIKSVTVICSDGSEKEVMC